MNIIEIKRVSIAVQGDHHIYKWSIKVTGMPDEKEMLEFCQKYLKVCKYDYDYYRDHLDNADVFYSGYYSLDKEDIFNWTYLVQIPFV